MTIRHVLTDIEGTTTPIRFVHDVLFPYSAQKLPDFVRAQHDRPEVRECLWGMGVESAIEQLLALIKADTKDPSLKKLQGMVWRDGYESGAFTSIVYPDVAPALAAWKERGLQLGVYSSGSVEAQKLLFKHTNAGDLTPYFSAYFDTAVGAKQERLSYRTIAERLGLWASELLFLSDVAAELDAAKAEGFETVQLLRDGAQGSGRHAEATSFAQIVVG